MRILDAERTSGIAELKMMHVMSSDTAGSKRSVQLPWKLALEGLHGDSSTYNQMTRPAEMTPTFPRLER
jgi:hypothetical protein